MTENPSCGSVDRIDTSTDETVQPTLDGGSIDVSLTVRELDDDEERPCDFCSTPEHQAVVRERGIIKAEYRLENTYGVPFGYSCRSCIAADVEFGQE